MAEHAKIRSRPSPEIAGELRLWLKTTGKTQAELARTLGVTQPHISRILAGDFSLRSDAVRRLCRYAKVEVVTRRPPREQELRGMLRTIWNGTESDAERVLAVLRAIADLGSVR